MRPVQGATTLAKRFGSSRAVASTSAPQRLSAAAVANGLRREAPEHVHRRRFSATSTGGGTRLGQYLEACGANWGDAVEVQDIVASQDGQTFAWQVDLPPERLATIRPGDPIESRPFEFMSSGSSQGVRARFQLFPKGDSNASDPSHCSLWLSTDSRERLPIRLRLASTEREGGASDFCRLEDALSNGSLQVSVSLKDGRLADASTDVQKVQQSLQLTDLKFAEWRLFNAQELFRAGKLVSSPPFRFHHVLLGDMYLEFQPGAPHPEHCAVFFRCRVPTMRLRVKLEEGSGSFSKTFEAVGRASGEDDLKQGRFLPVNMDAPNVFESDGSLIVRAALEEVVTIPAALRDMIPRLDERASWPKRL
mmetsp:Transcript_75012/g.202660  ORF Transcript_75012/g.202660 Transcript_75012/m.202660 type:complete len:364 (-) Transcript_75012:104-1195(-)